MTLEPNSKRELKELDIETTTSLKTLFLLQKCLIQLKELIKE